jgi:hypothetical protein
MNCRASATHRIACALVLGAIGCGALSARAEPVAVRQREGIVHGFLVLRTLTGEAIADGDLIQTSNGARVTSRLLFHFREGSVHDETTVFSQRRTFRLISHHLVQTGPAFPRRLDMRIDGNTGVVRVRYTDDDKQKTETERLDLPSDLANGLVSILLKNVSGANPPESLSFVAATPKPRLVRLKLSPAAEERFLTGSRPRVAKHYVVKVDIGGITGALAGLLGKEPPDSQVWILEGEAPAFVRSEQQLFTGGPLWRIELSTPRWDERDR